MNSFPLLNPEILVLELLLLPNHLEPLTTALLCSPLLPHKHHLKIRRRIPRLGSAHHIPNRIQRPAVPKAPLARNFGEEVTDIRTDVGVAEPCVLSRDLGFGICRLECRI